MIKLYGCLVSLLPGNVLCWSHCPNWVSSQLTCSVLKSLKSFNSFPNKTLVFMCLQYKSFENTVGKEEIARNEQFLLFPQCFPSFLENFLPFCETQNCRLQTLSVWKSLKFVVWERVKPESRIKSREQCFQLQLVCHLSNVSRYQGVTNFIICKDLELSLSQKTVPY